MLTVDSNKLIWFLSGWNGTNDSLVKFLEIHLTPTAYIMHAHFSFNVLL